ncbi:hypothetical protein Emag_002379 [Eimeria magna]
MPELRGSQPPREGLRAVPNSQGSLVSPAQGRSPSSEGSMKADEAANTGLSKGAARQLLMVMSFRRGPFVLNAVFGVLTALALAFALQKCFHVLTVDKSPERLTSTQSLQSSPRRLSELPASECPLGEGYEGTSSGPVSEQQAASSGPLDTAFSDEDDQEEEGEYEEGLSSRRERREKDDGDEAEEGVAEETQPTVSRWWLADVLPVRAVILHPRDLPPRQMKKQQRAVVDRMRRKPRKVMRAQLKKIHRETGKSYRELRWETWDDEVFE